MRLQPSYYTHEELVTLVIQRAVGPLVADLRHSFAATADALAGDRAPVAERLRRLQASDPASRMLDLKVCDPAMGSGHFLVTLVDWLSDEVLAAMDEATMLVEWGEYQGNRVKESCGDKACEEVVVPGCDLAAET